MHFLVTKEKIYKITKNKQTTTEKSRTCESAFGDGNESPTDRNRNQPQCFSQISSLPLYQI